MSYRKVQLSKYLRQYTKDSQSLEKILENVRNDFISGDEDYEERIAQMEAKIYNVLGKTVLQQRLVVNLGNRQIHWKERNPSAYVRFHHQPQEIDQAKMDNFKHIFRRSRVVFGFQLDRLRLIRHNMPILQSVETIMKWNPKTPSTFKIYFYFFGVRKCTRTLQVGQNGIFISKPELEFVVNFAESYISSSQDKFISSKIDIVLVDQQFVFASAEISVEQLLQHVHQDTSTKVPLSVMSIYGEPIAKLHLTLNIKINQVIKGLAKTHIINDKIVKIPQHLKPQIQFEFVNSKLRQSPTRREEMSHPEQLTEIHLVQLYKQHQKPHRNRQHINSMSKQYNIQLFTNEQHVAPISLISEEPKTIKLEYSVVSNPNKVDTSKLSFILNNLETDSNTLTIKPNKQYTIPFRLLFSSQGELKISTIGRIFNITVICYQLPEFKELKEVIKHKMDRHQQAMYSNIRFYYEQIPYRHQKMTATSGYWTKIGIVPTDKSIAMDKYQVRVFPQDVRFKWRHSERHIDVYFMVYVEAAIALVLADEDTKQIVFVDLVLEQRKTHLNKRIKVGQLRLYEVDLSEFMEAETEYEIMSMRPNYVQVVSKWVKYEQLMKKRSIHVRVDPSIQEDCEIVLNNQKTMSSISMILTMSTDA